MLTMSITVIYVSLKIQNVCIFGWCEQLYNFILSFFFQILNNIFFPLFVIRLSVFNIYVVLCEWMTEFITDWINLSWVKFLIFSQGSTQLWRFMWYIEFHELTLFLHFISFQCFFFWNCKFRELVFDFSVFH